MCILCVVQKWSRRVATMLPWLLFPLLGLWLFSHLLPPGFRFEFTSPRLACVFVLLVTIFWYEFCMPHLSAWRARTSAKYRERKRLEAIEMQKRRKMATRLCRNCLTPYRDQNPGGGRFMCSYCGHISKRPVLDIFGTAGSGNAGVVGDVVGKGGKECSQNGCIFSHGCLENGTSANGSLALKSNYRGNNAGGTSGCKLSMYFGDFWRKIFGNDGSSDTEHDDMFSKEGENGDNLQESKGEKARRKAEEKRQARLERELLEEEERKQREEVAKLVEEQRKLRDEKMEVEKECVSVKGSTPDREKYGKREAERKRQERRKEKDKGSSKSNSDCEDIERRAGKENDKKREFDKKRDQKTAAVYVRAHGSEVGHGSKAGTTNNFSRGNGARYLDRMKGSFMSSSKAFNGASFFGKGAHESAKVISKVSSHIGSVDHIQTAASRRELHSTEHVRAKPNSNGDDKISKTNSYRPVASEIQPRTTLKKSWRQLFTRSPAVLPFPTANFSSRSNQEFPTEAQSPFLPGQVSPSHPLADQISFGLPLPFSLSPFPNGSTSSSPISSSVAEPIYEEPDIFEDPCYDPDPVSLLGPVSESLDNFPLDLGTGLLRDTYMERPHGLKNLSSFVEVNKPSPIVAPLSRLRYVEERYTHSSSYPSTPKSQSMNTSPWKESSNEHKEGTWKMWSTPPLGHDGFGLTSGSASWLLPLGQEKSSQEEVLHPSSHKAITLQLPKENHIAPGSGTSSPQRLYLGNCQNGGTFSPPGPDSNDNDPWLQRSDLHPLPGDGQDHFPPLTPQGGVSKNKVTFSSSNSSPSNPSERSPANCWSK